MMLNRRNENIEGQLFLKSQTITCHFSVLIFTGIKQKGNPPPRLRKIDIGKSKTRHIHFGGNV